MYKLTEEANSDLAAIFAYTLHNFGLRQAESYTDSLITTFGILGESLKLGHVCPELGCLWRYQHKHHAIYYREHSQGILIVRILHQQMHAPNHLAP